MGTSPMKEGQLSSPRKYEGNFEALALLKSLLDLFRALE